MTKSARLVLDDAREAARRLPEFRPVPRQDEAVIRRTVVTAMTLLRAVGHVLDNVDGNRSPKMRKAVDEKWREKKPPIFKEFIEGYRAAILKRYEQPDVDFAKFMGTLYPILVLDQEGRQGVSLNILVAEAIEFWEKYLDDVDRRAANLN